MLRWLGRWFWIVGLGAAVLLFAGFSVFSLVLAVHERTWKWLWAFGGMALFADRAYGLFRRRFDALPNDPPPPLEDWEPPDFG